MQNQMAKEVEFLNDALRLLSTMLTKMQKGGIAQNYESVRESRRWFWIMLRPGLVRGRGITTSEGWSVS